MKKLSKTFALCSLLFAIYGNAVARDHSVDCAGRPRWDRFVVNENSDQWDPKSAKCFGVVSYDTPPPAENAAHLYGEPSMYGEYEENADGVRHGANARDLYGKYDANKFYEKPQPAPVRAAPAPAKPAPVVTKPVAKPAPEPKPEPKPEPAPKPAPKALPDSNASNIANTLNHPFDVDSYCTQINAPVKGPLPAGLVLMPGRPDLMSCVKK